MKRAVGMIAGALMLAMTLSTIASEHPAADPKHASKESPWENSLGMKFVPVKGTDTLFCVWLTRVQDFTAFVKATGYDATANMVSLREDGWKTTHGDNWESPGYPQGPAYPVGGVSWNDAKEFCHWLTGKERKEGKIGANDEYRLPTDAEWSLAVGLGPETGDTPKSKSGKIKGVYPWGTQWPPPQGAGNYAGEESKDGESTPQERKVNKAFNDVPSDWTVIQGYNDGYPRTSPVGSFPANEFGLYDMGGNLYEWCEDLLSKGAPIMRGTSFYTYKPGYILSSFRNSAGINHRCGGTGFRVVVSRSGSTLPSQ